MMDDGKWQLPTDSSAVQRQLSLQPSPAKNFLAGGLGGVCLTIVGHPPDTIKVRLQTQPKCLPGQNPIYGGFLDCVRKTVINEGIHGLYKGVWSPLLMTTFISATGFWGFRIGKSIQGIKETDKPSLSQIFLSGMFAGGLATIFTAPAERVKCLLQVQQSDHKRSKYSGIIDCAIKLYKSSGFSQGIYRGTCGTLLRDVPGIGIYFTVYEELLRILSPKNTRRSDLSPWIVLFCGGSAGVASWFLTIPFDTLKSRLQSAPDGTYVNGVRDVFKMLIREEGPKALFRGLVPVTFRAFPGCAASFLGYETGMKLLNWMAPEW